MSKKIRPRITEEEYQMIKGIRDQCNDHEVDIKHVKDGWLKNDTSRVRFINPAYQEPNKSDILDIDFESLIPNNKEVKVDTQSFDRDDAIFDRVVYTDVHIGMTTNEDGFSLYGGKWDKEELMRRNEIMIDHIITNQSSKEIHIHELGDLMDGWNGETTRKGHKLPQNMTNQEAFDTALEFKISQINTLVDHYSKIYVHNVCNDNHAGAFGYVVNSAFKRIIEQMYPSIVTVYNQRKFIDHYVAHNRAFLLTHGKDDKNLKFGFKPVLDKKQENKIDNYIKHNKLYGKGKIEFSKGDSHQYIFDYSSSETFDYCNYPAFSPSSEWVQTNFQRGISGFLFFNYFEDRRSEHPYLFDWEDNERHIE